MHSHEAQVQSYLPFFEEKGVFKSLFPQIPVKNNPQANEAAFAQVRADKAGVSLCS